MFRFFSAKEMFILPEHLISPLDFIEVHVILSFVSPHFMSLSCLLDFEFWMFLLVDYVVSLYIFYLKPIYIYIWHFVHVCNRHNMYNTTSIQTIMTFTPKHALNIQTCTKHTDMHLAAKKVKNIDTKQSNNRNNQTQKARLSHEIRRHKWQDNMNLYENQRWNQVLREDKHFLLRMRHPSWCPQYRIKEWNVLMTTISWSTDVISHGGHWNTIRECQMMVTTKKLFKYWSQSSFYETLIEKLPC